MASAQIQHKKVLSETRVLAMMKNDIKLAKNVICLPISTIRVLLDHFKWDLQAMTDSYFTNDKLTFEQAKCSDPESHVPVDNVSTNNCNLCLDDLDKTSMKHDPCGHAFCNSCWVGYLKQSIVTEGKSLRMECPMSSCSVFLDDDFIENVCREDQHVVDTYWSLLAKCYTEKNKTLSKCPGSKCLNTIYLADPSSCKVQCSCGEEFCLGCSRSYHYSLPCMLVEVWEEPAFNEDTKLGFVLLMTKKCPKCTMDIEKNGECPQIYCSWCDVDFCSSVLLPLQDHNQCKEEIVGEKQEIIEKRRFKQFHDKYQEMKTEIGCLNIDRKDEHIVWSLFTYRTDAQYELLIQKLPLKIISEKKTSRNVALGLDTAVKKGHFFISTEEVIESLRSEMVENTDVGWFLILTDHLDRAATVLEETKRVIVYSQIFAFYLGCQPTISGENIHDPHPHASNDPMAVDAEFFQLNLQNLEKSSANLTDSFLKVIHAFLSLKSRILLGEYGTQAKSKEDVKDFVDTIMNTDGEVVTNMENCIKKKEMVVSLMEDGIGDRIWKFKTISS